MPATMTSSPPHASQHCRQVTQGVVAIRHVVRLAMSPHVIPLQDSLDLVGQGFPQIGFCYDPDPALM